jgi:serine/threonine-protein kinase
MHLPLSMAMRPPASKVTMTAGPPDPPLAMPVRLPATSCRACAAPLAGSAGLPLCQACQEQAGNQEQPIPGYRMIRELGKGVLGVVFLALRESTGNAVAIKLISPDGHATPAQIDAFLRETAVLRELSHPNLVPLHDLGETARLLYFASEYVPAGDAAHFLKRGGPLPIGWAVRWIVQVLEVLEYAHARRFVHRDLKPANLLLAGDPPGTIVKVSDFGIARAYQASPLSGLTLQGGRTGTMAFTAPEQITQFRESRPAIDQYAAAATLYTLLTGKFIYGLPRTIEQRVLMILQKDPVPIQSRRPEIPDKLAAIIHRGLARLPADRFADVAAMRRALKPFAG